MNAPCCPVPRSSGCHWTGTGCLESCFWESWTLILSAQGENLNLFEQEQWMCHYGTFLDLHLMDFDTALSLLWDSSKFAWGWPWDLRQQPSKDRTFASWVSLESHSLPPLLLREAVAEPCLHLHLQGWWGWMESLPHLSSISRKRGRYGSFHLSAFLEE